MTTPRRLLALAVAMCLVATVAADMYLHFPPGSNDRNRERNENRNNGNRLFDSQNNGKGGYPYRGDATLRALPDPVTYYTGSILRLEWTNQHACGPNQNIGCQVIIQYGCEDEFKGLRDGYPDSATLVAGDNNNAGYLKRQFSGEAGQNQQGTNTIPENQYPTDAEKRAAFYDEGAFGGIEYGYHESITWYDTCKNTLRNKGVYTADQNMNGRNSAKTTRQDNNGNRHGLECPEERDYYPYWRPVPWVDVAILTSRPEDCDWLQDNSQNVVAYGWCECDATCRGTKENALTPITEEACIATSNPGVWMKGKPNGGGKPVCRLHSFGRDNHLGNTAPISADGGITSEKFQPETAHYDWKIPSAAANQLCVLRFRYNISTFDYSSMAHTAKKELDRAEMLTVADNCLNEELTNAERAGTPSAEDIANSKPQCQGLLTKDVVPLFNRPYVKVFGAAHPALSIALNTDQSARTFQDRSYVFRVAKAPSAVSGTIYNLGLRGRRGNIVQAYPAVEYDFVPSELKVTQGDWIHIQLHGSSFNQAQNNNNGEGWQYSDRANIVEVDKQGSNFPSYRTRINLFDNEALARRFALLDQTGCGEYFNGAANEQNAIDNCGKLNRAPNRFPEDPTDGLMRVNQAAGAYHYVSTRNNNFSNRSQKSSIYVSGAGGLSEGEKAAIGVGVTLAIGLAAFGLLAYGKKKPASAPGRMYAKLAGCCGKGKLNRMQSGRAPEMEYQRS